MIFLYMTLILIYLYSYYHPDNLFCLLSIGGTPLGMYKKLIEYYQQGKISFKYVKTFNMDEYVDLPRDHPESYHYYMYNNFFKHIDIDPKNVHILDGNATDLEKECDNFEEKIKEAGGIELFIGGIITITVSLNINTRNF